MTSLNAGLRFTSSSLRGDWNQISSIDKLLSSLELDSEALTYTLAVTYRPNKKLQINGLFSSGFRNPNICLLYTSPSPRDRTRSRMPSSA